MTSLQDALLLAAERHHGSDREGDAPLPYLTHVVEVLTNLRHVGGVTDEDLLVAACLHDTVEEEVATLEEIEARFGKRAADLVEELTRREPGEAETASLSPDEVWRLRADMLLEEIRRMSPDAQRVKLADRLSNLREALRTKQGRKRERYVWGTERILKAVPRTVNPPLWDAIQGEIGSK